MTEPVTVVGAGVAGLCVAHELVARGTEVRLVDPADVPGPGGCSWWAGGMLAPDCEGATASEPIVRLGQGAAGWWRAAGVEVAQKGTLVVALERDRTELDRFARRTKNHRSLAADEIAALEPDLDGRFARALHFEDEAHLSPRNALKVLCDGLARRGVEIRGNAPNGGQIVDCRGLAARDRLPTLRGVRGEMAFLRTRDVTLSRPVRLLHPRHPLYIVPRGEGLFMLGATQVESDGRGAPTLRSTVELLSAAYALHPAFGEAEVVELGADARPAFPDNIPRIVRQSERICINGLFRHGFLLAPALARMAASLVVDHLEPELIA